MEHATTRHSKAANFDSLPDSAFVRVDTVAALRDSSRATTWRHAKMGLIPSPRKIGPGITAWNVGELRACLAAAGKAGAAAE
jgi:prophage regulatory protein